MSHARVSCLMVTAILALSCSAVAAKEKQRSYVSGNYLLVLDGVKCGYVKSVDGGAITAEVINEAKSPGNFVKKHIGQPRYQDFELQVGFSMTRKVYEWIAQSWSMAAPRMNGSVIAADYKLQPISERQFNQAVITETTIPAMDGSSKEPAYITLKFAPEYIRTAKPSDGKAGGEFGKSEQKLFLPCNFRLEIDGLDCSRVNKIDSFTVKQTVVAGKIGEKRDSAKEPAKLEFPNLKITLAETTAQSWIDWHEDFVIKGNNEDSKEKNGSLTLLSPNGKEELLRIRIFNMGICRLQPEKGEANTDQIGRLQAELYVERMEFEYKGPSADAGATEATPAAPTQNPTPAVPRTLRRAG